MFFFYYDIFCVWGGSLGEDVRSSYLMYTACPLSEASSSANVCFNDDKLDGIFFLDAIAVLEDSILLAIFFIVWEEKLEDIYFIINKIIISYEINNSIFTTYYQCFNIHYNY